MSETLFSYAPTMSAEMAGQWRLSRIQLLNWGTIDQYFDLPVPRKGLLLTGESGSGKSTILDAISTVLTQDGKTRYNTAAAAGTGGDQDRSRLSYVRGAYAREGDAKTGEVHTLYLRTGATRSGIALSFENGSGQTWSALRVFYIGAKTMNSADLHDQYITHSGPVELREVMEQVVDSAFRDALRKEFKPRGYEFHSKPTAFQARLQKATGIGSDKASQLLHKTIATKNVNSLDTLMRDYMLDVPGTEDEARRAVSQFQDLRAAHQDVVDAKSQIDLLAPLEKLVRERAGAIEQAARAEELAAAIDIFRIETENAIDEKKLSKATQELQQAQGKLAEITTAIDSLENRRSTLEAQVNEYGGTQLAVLREQAGAAERDLERCEKQRAEIQPALGYLRVSLPEDQAAFMALKNQAQAEITAMEQAGDEALNQLIEVGAKLREAQTQISDLDAELKSLARRNSALPARLITLRRELCEDLGLSESALPFAAELIDVQDDSWRGAIEKLLANYGRTLLVGTQDGDKVAAWVNGRRLQDAKGRGMRLEYERVPLTIPEATRQALPESVLRKVKLAENVFGQWVWIRLLESFDYVGVEQVEELADHDYAITRQGLMRRGARHVKDDRHRLDDPSQWILGTNNQARVEALLAKREALAAEREEATKSRAALQNRQREIEVGKSLLQTLLTVEFADIDAAGIRQKIAQIEDSIARLSDPSTDVGRALAELEEVKASLRAARAEYDGANQRVGAAQQNIATLQQAIQAREEQLWERELAAEDRAELTKLCGLSERRATAQSLEADIQRGREALRRQRENAENARRTKENRITGIQKDYVNQWAQFATNMVAELDGVEDFIARYRDLNTNNLPKFRQRFRQLLAEETQQSISSIAEEIRSAFGQVKSGITPVNESLAQTPYDSGQAHFLRIEVREAKSKTVQDFLADLRKITEGQFGGEESDEAADARFALIEKVMNRLGSEEAGDKHWRREVLDTRRHVSFVARVLDKNGDEQDIYDSSKGRSGGQSQKLVTFCLAAALRYRLADRGKYEPRYGTIILDEAFDKTDPRFTRDSLEVFKTFGFQLVLATPMKMIQAFEPYIGGVVQTQLGADHRTVLAITQYRETGPATS